MQSSLSALPDGRTRFTVRSTLLFVVKPNGFIKAMIERGACALCAPCAPLVSLSGAS